MSRPGYPRELWQPYSYSSSYFDGHTTYSGSNSGGFQSFWRDAVGANTPGWPHIKGINQYYTISGQVQDTPLAYQFDGPGGISASGSDSSARKVFTLASAANLVGWSWDHISQVYGEANYPIINGLINQVKDQKVNIAQVYAERHQTVNLISSTARRVAESFMSLRRGNLAHALFTLTGSSRPSRGIRRVAGGVPELWLSIKYGWQPLLQDMYGACEELAKLVASPSPPPFVHVKSTGRAQKEVSFTYPSGTHEPDWLVDATVSAHGRGFVQYMVDSAFASTISRTGLTNPAQLVWELLPYSFVVDWFLPVGNFLAQLDYSSGLAFRLGWMNMNVELNWTAKPTNTNRFPYGFTSGHWSGGGASGTVKYFGRLPLTGFPSPVFPRLKDPFSSTHVANALSLLATAFSSSSRIR